MSCEQYLIQSLMWRQCVSEELFKQMVKRCLKVNSMETESEVSPEVVSRMVSKVNRNIRSYNMQISRGPNESDGTVYYALINNADNDMTRLSSQWTHKEILYFRRLMSSIIESENAFISSTKGLNIGREEELKFSITAAENLINKWVEQKWLEEVGDGNYALGVRTILEMNVYIREHFEVQDCFRCKTLCIRGSNCMSCDTKLHFHCVDSQFIPNNKCPNCAKQWTNNSEVLANSSSGNSSQTMESNNGSHSVEEQEEEVVEQSDQKRMTRSKKPKRS